MMMLLMNTVTLYSFSPKRCSVYTKSFLIVLSVEVNYAYEMWACHFWEALQVQHNAL